MWTLVFRKILNNKWLMLCLLFGFIVVVAMVSAVPMYSNAILQKMLNDDLISYQGSHSIYAGLYQTRASYGLYSNTGDAKQRAFNIHMQTVREKFDEIREIAVTGYDSASIKAQNMILTPYDEADPDNSAYKKISAELNAVSGMEPYTAIVSGRMYKSGLNSDGEYEFVCTEVAYNDLGLNLGSLYRLGNIMRSGEVVKARLVGVVTIAENTSDYWYIAGGIEKYSKNILMDYDTMLDMLFTEYSTVYLYEAEWRLQIDYTALSIDNLTPLIDAVKTHELFFDNASGFTYFRVPMYDTLVDYTVRSATLKLELWVILVPILVMLALYIFMVTKTIITNDADEIAMLRSRGASNKQIFLLYLYESLILGGLALLLGPQLAYFMCMIMGSANGFLEFIGRSALPVKINFRVYLYAIAAVLFFVLMMLVPALGASRSSIVERKRRHSRFAQQPIWKKFFLDIILLGIGIYGYFNYQSFSSVLNAAGGDAVSLGIDPLMFVLSSCFIIGAGLFFLRLYPYLIRLIFLIGRRKWSPNTYAAFIQVSRSSGAEQFLMIFLILAVAVGIFSANAARTLNQNIEDRIRYDMGADISMSVEWLEEDVYGPSGFAIPGEAIKIEPDFTQFQDIEGAEGAAKVYVNRGAKMQSKANSSSQSGITLMGIDPAEFSKVTWTRNDLFYPYHINAYLKLLSEAPRGIMISSSLAETLNVSVGDVVNVSINDETPCEMIVYAIINYWPSIQPYDTTSRWARYGGGVRYNHFAVCNLTYLHAKFAKDPYQVWIKKASGVTDTDIFNYIDSHRELRVQRLNYADQQLIQQKNDPLLQGFNGMLTLGFIITMFICVIGFLIYWVISIRARTMQFGVLRAMGMPFSGILRMILVEQLLISFVSILVGVILGGIASDLFVPLLEVMFPITQNVPAFQVVALRSDYYKVYTIIGAMLVVGILVLARLIGRTKMDQALKLGED